MDITPDTLEWIRNCFKDLLDTSTTKHFFAEKRSEDNCMWVRKTKNKSKTSITVEIFRIDNKGRKCSILVPEGPDSFGWKSFLALITFRPSAPTKRICSEIRKEFVSKYSDSFSSDSDSSRKSYAKALSDSSEEENKKRYKSTSDDSSSRRSSTIGFKPFTLSGDSFEKTVIVTRRCFHDDWNRIMFSLRKQSEIAFSYKPFQADKAFLFLNPDHAKLLCSNKSANGWSTVGNYQRDSASFVELQYFSKHWFGLWRIPCVVKETMQMEKLIDAKIKVRYNYIGFVPASVLITDNQGENFILTTVPPTKARWLVERNVRVHGTFKTKAADEFDQHNPLAEAYTYNGFQAIPLESTRTRGDYSFLNSDKHSVSNHTQAKKNNSSESEYDPFDQQLSERRKEKGKVILLINDQDHGHYSKRSKRISNRKVSFLSPGCIQSYSSNTEKNIEGKSLEISTINDPFEKRWSPRQKSKIKLTYRIKNDPHEFNEDQKLSLKEYGEGSKQMNLSVDMGPISPLDSMLQSENNHGQDSLNNQTKTKAKGEVQNQTDSVKEGNDHNKSPSRSTTDGISKDAKTDSELEIDRAFKEKLVIWLKENELKLSPKYTNDVPSSSYFPVLVSDQNGDLSGHGPLGDKGIIVLWDDTKFKVNNIKVGSHSISINVLSTNGNWWLTSVYGPYKNNDRTNLWLELELLQTLCVPNWLIIGDFNIVRWKTERNAKSLDRRNMANFNNFISVNELIDPPPLNNKYTWSNLRLNPTYSCLDRFLLSKGWENTFGLHTSRTMERIVSDHFPIILESPQIKWGPCPFRLNNSSLKDKEFQKNFPDWWNNSKQFGFPGYAFIQSLKSLSKLIKEWQHNKVNLYDAKRKVLLEEIDSIDKLELQGNMSTIHHQKRISLKSELLSIENNQALIWHQRSRQRWNLLGDENNAFFHRVCTINQRKNQIKSICDPNGTSLDSIGDISRIFISHFQNIYTKENYEEILIDNLNWNPISCSHQSELCKPFDEQEIKSTIMSISNEKAPGPDGYTILFYKKHWTDLKGDLLNVLKDFHKKGIVNNNVNNTFIALISKKEKCTTPSDYRPISLTTSLYKIMAKALANRLKSTLPDTVAEN
ncbi:LINE-1 retrotransposable element ORF2 protein [Cucumis melo var. makuwa]|uniref:LINE-1 retrotransposable element ORF2 protein n=1 Tax=Cucumis melo var. makuwa TaxID=1194695 RepID=A0A5D3DFM9_CUCMM|nr:LINE-1 retrotransposable element ORF2 protein [Cucumis melo var. makuwa]TYK22402.1 LINE-1 retrotransposable element ORF2 protein [Cucumis melo var. makuwa]